LSSDFELGVEMPLEPSGRRDLGIVLAEAEIEREEFSLSDARRTAAVEALSAYYRCLHLDRQLDLARRREGIARELAATVTERYDAGDAPAFEVKLSEAEIARAGSDVLAAERDLLRAKSVLAAFLGLETGSDFTLEGDLADRSLIEDAPIKTGPTRPDILRAEAEIKVAMAENALAKLASRPQISISLNFAKEEDAHKVMAGVSVALPFFNRGQGDLGEISGRLAGAQISLEALRRSSAAEIQGARAAYAAAQGALRLMEEEVIPLQEANEGLALESYRAGKIGLVTLLQIRGDLVATLSDTLDRSLETALARVDLMAVTGAPFHRGDDLYPQSLPPRDGN
jgi:cobalt-zinc-cadmium efflux system outer membrane protein